MSFRHHRRAANRLGGSLPQTDMLMQAMNTLCFAALRRRRRRVTLRKESRSEGEAGISLLGLTPGTPFMARVADSLAFYACQRLQQGSYQGVAFEVSGATVPVSRFIASAPQSAPPCKPPDGHASEGGPLPAAGRLQSVAQTTTATDCQWFRLPTCRT